jgi:tellurite resistance protein TerC
MALWSSWRLSTEFYVLLAFHLCILSFLAIDLGLVHRSAKVVSLRQALLWSLLWILLALAFAAGIARYWELMRPEESGLGPQRALEFLAGYLIEKALSIDNLFVFLVIFRYFDLPARLEHRVLTWGLVGAIILRAAFVVAGAALLKRFHWATYGLAVLLLYTGVRLAVSSQPRSDPGRNPVFRLARRFLRVDDSYDADGFWTKRDGVWRATPLPLVLLVVESTDVTFAIDSIPAVFAVTSDPFIVYTSNIFAILGLRALFFLLAGLLGKLRYLHIGLGTILALVGLKMLVQEWYALSVGWSLLIIAIVLGISIVSSLVAGPAPTESP